MEKDYRYYESKLQSMLDAKYIQMAKSLRDKGMQHEQIVDAIMKENAKDLMEAIHVGENPSTN